ncbi:MAG: MFS transporter [Acidimicrobiia bacterium]
MTDPTVRQKVLTAQNAVVQERETEPGEFILEAGPFTDYRRRVVLEGTTAHEIIEYRLAIPYFRVVFAPLVRRYLKRHPSDRDRFPGWAPPTRLDARASTVLGVLAAISLIVGYVNTLLTQTITFAADEFGSSERAQGIAGTVVRAGIVLTLGVAGMIDRRGRRYVIVLTALVAPIIAALGALAPSLPWLTATQLVARPMALVLGVTITVAAAEEMPRQARAYALGLLTMSIGLGAGVCVIVLRVSDLGEQAWRLVYVAPLLFVPLVLRAARKLPETARFETHHRRDHQPIEWRRYLPRFVLLAASGLLINLLVAPASFFQNRFLDNERGYSATAISNFTLFTTTPAGLGVLIGGRIAERRGRRGVALAALAANTLGTAAFFFAKGWGMWAWSLLAAVIGGAMAPSLGVYGAELFPTAVRGRLNNAISIVSLTGSSAGLLFAGWWISAGHSYGMVMALLSLGPLVVMALVAFVYPETAGEELEDLNPEDRDPATSAPSPML